MAAPPTRDAPARRNSPEVEAAFRAVPDEQVAEIVGGELHVSPRPARPHTRVASRLGALLAGPFDLGRGGPGGWVILDEPELHLGTGPDVPVPDLAGWRRERLPDAFGGEDALPYYDVAPDWVCEVLSTRTGRLDRARKMPVYAREGVSQAWLVDPLLQTLEVYRREGERWLLLDVHAGAVTVRAEPFESLELDLALLWAR